VHKWLIEEFKRQKVVEGRYYEEYEIVDESGWNDPYRYQGVLPRRIDLLIVTNKIDYICEFKTKLDAESIEKAVGQLMIYEKLYTRKCSKPVRKIAVFYGEDLAEENIEKIARPGSVMWEMMNRRRADLKVLAEIFDQLGITLYIYINGSFHKMNENEPEKKLEKALEKKKAKLRATRRALLDKIEEAISSRLLRTDTVTVNVKDMELVVEVKPKEGWEFRWARNEPLVYTRRLKPLEVEAINRYMEGSKGLRDIAKEILNEVLESALTAYYGECLKPLYLFSERKLAARAGGPTRAGILMANLAKIGSPWHASFLAQVIPNLIKKWRIETDPDVRYYMTEGLSEIGFPTLEEILHAIDPMEIPYNEMLEFVTLVSEGVKDVLSQYARVYESPDHLTDEDIRKTLELCDELAKRSEDEWFKPVVFDESPLISILTKNRDLIPTIWERISPIISERKEVIEELQKEEKRKETLAEEVTRTIVEEMKEKKLSERELIDIIKEEILRRTGQL